MAGLLPSHHTLRSCARFFGTFTCRLAGHNKWSKIKEGKGANDGLKSKIYGKANRDIILAVRSGGTADPAVNSLLASAIAKAKANGVPKANITSALEQARKGRDSGSQQEYTFGALLKGKVGLNIECFSDNSTRTAREIKETLKSHGAQLAPVSYMFKRVGQILVRLRADQSLEVLEDEALEGGAEDIEVLSSESPIDPVEVKITVPAGDFLELDRRLKFEDRYSVQDSEIVDLPAGDPDAGTDLDEDVRLACRRLIEELEEHPDVHHVRVSPQL